MSNRRAVLTQPWFACPHSHRPSVTAHPAAFVPFPPQSLLWHFCSPLLSPSQKQLQPHPSRCTIPRFVSKLTRWGQLRAPIPVGSCSPSFPPHHHCGHARPCVQPGSQQLVLPQGPLGHGTKPDLCQPRTRHSLHPLCWRTTPV